jgi:transglutaminase-like putative cysteine protease
LLPRVTAFEFTDHFGNLCQRLVAPAGVFAVSSSAVIQTAAGVDENSAAAFVEVQNLPTETLSFLLPSRYCESDRLCNLATEITTGYLPGYSQVAAIVNWIEDNVAYHPGSSNVPVTALETLSRKYGVCRDLAQLGIALCRSLCIPARMVVGYLHALDPMDMHAWFEVYVGHRWYTLDPTQAFLGGARVAVAYGRDAADVAVFTQYGDPVIPVRQHVSVEQFLDAPE